MSQSTVVGETDGVDVSVTLPCGCVMRLNEPGRQTHGRDAEEDPEWVLQRGYAVIGDLNDIATTLYMFAVDHGYLELQKAAMDVLSAACFCSGRMKETERKVRNELRRKAVEAGE